MDEESKAQVVTGSGAGKRGPAARLLTIPQASERLSLKPATVRFWIWTRKIEHVKVGRSVRLREDTIDNLIQRGTVPARRRQTQ